MDIFTTLYLTPEGMKKLADARFIFMLEKKIGREVAETCGGINVYTASMDVVLDAVAYIGRGYVQEICSPTHVDE